MRSITALPLTLASLIGLGALGCAKGAAPVADTTTASGGGRQPKVELPAQFSFSSTECPNLVTCRKAIDAFPRGYGTDKFRDNKGKTAKVKVHIAAFQGAKDISPTTPPPKPTLILELIDLGKDPTEMYSLSSTKDADYYIVAEDDGTGKATKLTMWELPAKNGTPKPYLFGTLSPCNHPLWPVSIADFATCGNDPIQSKPMTKMNTSSLASAFIAPLARALNALLIAFQGPEDPGWVSCTDGCCTLNGFQFQQQ